jgi:diadenosine tetraphosphatase ApaH/serine/threonine PP2A family protein phosphatase
LGVFLRARTRAVVSLLRRIRARELNRNGAEAEWRGVPRGIRYHPVMGSLARVALFGGIYNNLFALAAAIADARRRGCEKLFCLGDLGAFGPHPDKVFPLLIDQDVQTMQGNYDHSIGHDLPDCQCGYTDPADNYYARLSYQYTYRNTSAKWRPWLAELPKEMRFEIGFRGQGSGVREEGKSIRVLCCHGSPRKTNEFLWESTTPTHLLEKFAEDYGADVIVATHTGLPWTRPLSNGRLFVNCGVLGRPANDGTTRVGYTILDASAAELATYVPLEYDHEGLAAEMKAEALPAPFIETVLSGWWTTCLEILPVKERGRGKY